MNENHPRAAIETTWLVDDDPAIAVAEMLAIESGKQVVELRPLGHSIDTDAMETLLKAGGTDVELSFTYEGYTVVLRSDGYLSISRPQGSSD